MRSDGCSEDRMTKSRNNRPCGSIDRLTRFTAAICICAPAWFSGRCGWDAVELWSGICGAIYLLRRSGLLV